MKSLCTLVLAALLLSCTANRAPDAYQSSDVLYYNESSNRSEAPRESRKISYSASMTLVAKEPDTIIMRARQIAESAGGYLLQRSDNYLSVNVPATALEPTLDRMGELAKERDRSISGVDFTEEYTDIDIRLGNATKTRDRYLALLDQAKDVEDILAIERELERLNVELERLQGRKNKLDELETYSRIDLRVEDKPKIGPLGYVFYGVWEALEWLF